MTTLNIEAERELFGQWIREMWEHWHKDATGESPEPDLFGAWLAARSTSPATHQQAVQAQPVAIHDDEPKRSGPHDWGNAKHGSCDHCGEHRSLVTHDGAMTCGGCLDFDYLAAWQDYARQLRAALATQPQPAVDGEIVVTRNEAGQIVSVTRQDDEGRILSVIAESPKPPGTHTKPAADALDTATPAAAVPKAVDLPTDDQVDAIWRRLDGIGLTKRCGCDVQLINKVLRGELVRAAVAQAAAAAPKAVELPHAELVEAAVADAKYVFSDSCSHAHQAIDYLKVVLEVAIARARCRQAMKQEKK